MAGTSLALVHILALSIDQFVTSEARANGLMIDYGTIASSTGVVVTRIDTLVRLFVTIPVLTALFPGQALHAEAANLSISGISQMSLWTLAHGLVLRCDTQSIESALNSVTGVLALAADAAQSSRTVRILVALIG